MKKKEKQWLSIALSAAMVVTGIPATGIGTTVQAASGEAQVSVKNGEVTIGNEYLVREPMLLMVMHLQSGTASIHRISHIRIP